MTKEKKKRFKRFRMAYHITVTQYVNVKNQFTVRKKMVAFAALIALLAVLAGVGVAG